ncbi:MAG: glycosyltransferase family 2 protein [Candidatus Pacearchaeota archaeon]
MKTNLSFIICTYNQPELIKRCVDSILRQKNIENIEIILVDGGSEKETLLVLENYKNNFKNIKILNNPQKLPEGFGKGKWLGWKSAKGKFVAMVDQDNELQGNNWINEMLKPFSKEDIFGCACRVMIKENDNLVNKYVALMGTDPFFAYRSLDGIINLKKIGEEKEDCTVVKIDKNNIIVTGGNCFIYKKSYLDEVGGYTQDTENIKRLIKKGYNKIAIPKKAYTHHWATNGFSNFLKKKKKWASVYEKKEKTEFSYMPQSKKERRDLIINLFCSFTILPNILISIKKFVETREKAWFLHPILTFLTGIIYFLFSFIGITFHLSNSKV